MALIKINKLNKSYTLSKGNHEIALKDLSMELKSGELVAIYGPSGCGKSTLLNIISGLDRSYEGDISIDNKSLKTLSETQLAIYRKEKIGFIFQNFNLIPHMTVLENVMLPMKLNGDKKNNSKSRALELLKSLGVDQFIRKKPNQLSGGQRQRVAIARALVNDPDIIIADEPTGALDSESQAIVLDILRNLSKQGKLVIVVTHNKEVVQYSDHLIKMKDGLVISDEVINTTKFVESKMEKKKYNFRLVDSLKIAYYNFNQRKIRNIVVALGTSIGLTGILLSLGVGSGIIQKINSDMKSGEIPSQIQVMINSNSNQSTFMNDDSQKEITNLIGKDNIKYFEMPFGIVINEISIGDKSLDLSNDYPSYAQLRSEYSNNEIEAAYNKKSSILEGNVSNNSNEVGLTTTKMFVDDYNKQFNTKLKCSDFVGKDVTLKLVQATPNGNKYLNIKTKIIRVLNAKKQINEENSYMSYSELESVFNNNGLDKIVNYGIVQLENVDKNKEIINKINKGNKYIAISEQSTLQMVVKFIKIIQGLVIFMSSQAIIVAGVMIAIVLHISVVERTREIGIMKAIGYKNRFVSQIFLSESFIINAVANAISISLSLILGLILNSALRYKYAELSGLFNLKIGTIILVFAISSVLSIIAGLIPARKAMKLDPANALRYE